MLGARAQRRLGLAMDCLLLATFAEQITGSIDIGRMKRISLRIEAIAMVLSGADFVEVFRYFIAAGQSAEESFSSAQRVGRARAIQPSP